LGFVYVCGLFVPLMDNDSAHHANIALHMYLTGDYVSLIDYNGAYLDKPHLLFWLAAFSYKIFGVTAFAYKLPSLLFTILALYSTYRLGKSLYNKETGKLAALILASSFSFVLANNDVRMDAILTACVAFSTWQLTDFIISKKWINVCGAALGLALGFSVKGQIALLVPALAAILYIAYRRDWKIFYNPKWLVMAALFAAGIFPVVYCYYLQFNLHPEVVVRGKDHIDGVKFILFNQSVERFGGVMGHDAKKDYFFFIHSFLWAFAPWSLFAYYTLFLRLKNIRSGKHEWMTSFVFIVVLLIVSFSGFKLPHYLNIIFPITAVMTASYLSQLKAIPKWIRPVQFVTGLIIIVSMIAVNFWAFPVERGWVYAGLVITLALFIYSARSPMLNSLQKAICMTVAAFIIFFFMLNTSFYPQLLRYQAGNMLAAAVKDKVDRKRVYHWGLFSSSFEFYTRTNRQVFADSVINNAAKSWVLYDLRNEKDILEAGYKLSDKVKAADYEITKLDLKFVNPSTRNKQLDTLVIAMISK
jgi:4-amino-4-deoxy-L-arabinose transferase-like glycosyltransferase